jgi:hypothetical protein
MKKVLPKMGKYNVHSFSVKKCPGVVEYGMTGFILRAWQDIVITTEEDGVTYKWETTQSPSRFISRNYVDKNALDHEVSFFDPELYFNYFPRQNTLKTTLKINTPWYVDLPKGYKLLYAPVWYDNEERFTTVPGILDPTTNNSLKVILYWHKIGTTEVIKAGTPLARLIPFKSEKWNAQIKEATPEVILESEASVVRHYNGPISFF